MSEKPWDSSDEKIKNLAKQIGTKRAAVKKNLESREIHFENGSTIRIAPLSGEALRGKTTSEIWLADE